MLLHNPVVKLSWNSITSAPTKSRHQAKPNGKAETIMLQVDHRQQGKARDNKLQVNLPPSASQATPYASPRRTKKTVRITLTK
ncbi:hypothetical protein Tco_1183456 [Tanacetum coccineum]